MKADLTVTILFRKSSSKNYNKALKLSKLFENALFSDQNQITIPLREIFEKWEYFNQLFWITVNWKHTSIKYNGMQYYCHTDKTMIFYSLQQSYLNWRNFTSYKLVNSYRIINQTDTLENIENEFMTSEQADQLIDYYNIKKKNKKQ
jgi:hypothetical protein